MKQTVQIIFPRKKKNETIENTPKLGRCSNHSNNKNNNNDLIYQSGKNNFIRYNTRYNTSDRKEKDDNDIINNDKKNSFYKNKSNDKPIKVSRIYKNKIIQKKADNNGNNNFIYNISNKDGNTTTNTIIKYEKNDTVENIDNKSDYVRSKRCYMKMKKSNEKKL